MFIITVKHKVYLHFLWWNKQINHLPEGILKIHLPKLKEALEVLLPFSCRCEMSISFMCSWSSAAITVGSAQERWVRLRWRGRWCWRRHFGIWWHDQGICNKAEFTFTPSYIPLLYNQFYLPGTKSPCCTEWDTLLQVYSDTSEIMR